jgi:hypothetical protein
LAGEAREIRASCPVISCLTILASPTAKISFWLVSEFSSIRIPPRSSMNTFFNSYNLDLIAF